jgi:phenylacetate-CoA ligase
MSDTAYFDERDTLDPHRRQGELLAKIPDFLLGLKSRSATWHRLLSGIDAHEAGTPDGFVRIPLLRKENLSSLQKQEPPFGGLAAQSYVRAFQSPGSIYEPQGDAPDAWGFARALHAAGIRPGDLVHNCFSYHLTPGGFMFDEAARALGAKVFPAGSGNTEMQVEAIAHLKPQAYIGTPDFLKVILDKARELGRDTSSITKAFVSGGALFPSLRAEYQSRGIAVYQGYGTADAGCIAYETPALQGMVVNEDRIVEIVRPGTGEPVPDGDVGELVVTVFHETYPLVRFATGDLSAILPGESPCGRTNRRIKGWLGRADQTTKVKGMFVHPSQVAEIARRHAGLGRVRLVISREGEQDAMTLRAESATADPTLQNALAESLSTVTKMRGRVEIVPPGTLPNDGKVIADERTYS